MSSQEWIAVCDAAAVAPEGGACIRYRGAQIALFRVGAEWYAVQNRCPHWNEMVLSRALTGACGDEPKIACPMHKKTFSLRDGRCLSGEDYAVATFNVEVRDGVVYIREPSEEFVRRETADVGRPAPARRATNGSLDVDPSRQQLDAQAYE